MKYITASAFDAFDNDIMVKMTPVEFVIFKTMLAYAMAEGMDNHALGARIASMYAGLGGAPWSYVEGTIKGSGIVFSEGAQQKIQDYVGYPV